MKNQNNNLHVQKNKVAHNWNVFLLLIPSVIFAVTLAIVFKLLVGTKDTSSTQDSVVFAEEKNKPKLEVKEISIGEVHVQAEVAKSEIERRKGLSGRSSLLENSGMLFFFDQEDVYPPFWMKDMEMAIDIIWINDSQIVQIDHSVQPSRDLPESELKLYLPSQPIDYVLETAAGFSEKNNLQLGDTLTIL